MEANASSGTELSKLISAVVYLIGYQFGTAGQNEKQGTCYSTNKQNGTSVFLSSNGQPSYCLPLNY